jgi:DNA-binding response OmpR family regulator
MNGPRHILIVGAEPAQRDTLADTLEAGGMFQISEASSAADALLRTQSRHRRLDAIVMQASFDDGDAVELCARLRRRELRVPIIVLGDTAAEHDIVRTLDAGANDYVVKPVRMAELKARLRAQIREHETSEDAVLTIGPYHFRPGARSLHEPIENQQIRLTQKEVTILKCLYRAAGRPVSRQILLQEVWSYSAGARTHTVETHIYRLRRKIEPDPTHPTVIVNEGGGYCLGMAVDADAPSPRPPLRLALAAAK